MRKKKPRTVAQLDRLIDQQSERLWAAVLVNRRERLKLRALMAERAGAVEDKRSSKLTLVRGRRTER